MRYGDPSIPQVPRPQTTRGRWLARQRADDSHGRFSERLLMFNFGPVPAGGFATLVQTVTSQSSRFVRCLAMRGTTSSSRAPTGLDEANCRLRLQLNGDNHLIGGNGTNPSVSLAATGTPNTASFATLFDDITSPWYRFLSPILLRAGDLLTATLFNVGPTGELAATLNPEVGLRLIDDELWQELYTRDWRAERSL